MTPDRRTESPAVQGIASGLDDDRTRTRDYRRESDARLDQLIENQTHQHDCTELVKLDVRDLKEEMRRNTEVTEQIRDILASFRVVGKVAKWVGTIGAAAASCIAAFKAWR